MLSNSTYTNKTEDMSSQIIGVTSYPIVNGSFEFKELTIYADVAQQYYIIVYSQAIGNNNTLDMIYSNEKEDIDNLYFYSIPVIVSICDPGYVYTALFNS